MSVAALEVHVGLFNFVFERFLRGFFSVTVKQLAFLCPIDEEQKRNEVPRSVIAYSESSA